MPDILDAVRSHAFADDSASILDTYMNSSHYSGAWFETIGGRGDVPEVATRFTTADIVAVSTLGVRIPGWAAIEILDRRANDLNRLLSKIAVDVELHEASEHDLEPIYEIHGALDDIADIGHVSRSKLLARKRPHLVPIRDQHVLEALIGQPYGDFTEPLRDALRDDTTLPNRLDALRREVGHAELSLIRTLDIVVWMRAYGAQSIES